MAALQVKPDQAYFELAMAMFGPEPTPSQESSMRRAIGALVRNGAITTRTWWINDWGQTHSGMSVQLAGYDPFAQSGAG